MEGATPPLDLDLAPASRYGVVFNDFYEIITAVAEKQENLTLLWNG